MVMDGQVKVRRKLFFFKKRYMILLEDGTVYMTKEGHITFQIVLDKRTEITLLNKQRFEIKTPKFHEIIEAPEEQVETWMSILKSIRKMNDNNN